MKFTRREALLSGASVLAMTTPAAAAIRHGIFATTVTPPPPSPGNVWMEAPDILAFQVDDSQLIRGNTVIISPASTQPYNTWFSAPNPRDANASELCQVIGGAKTTLRFSDLPCATYVDRASLHDRTKYSLIGSSAPSITALYYRDETLDEGNNYSPGIQTISSFRHTVYLRLSAPLVNDTTYQIANSGGAFLTIAFTYNDKTMRANPIKVSQAGIRADDALKLTYLASRIPGHPNGGIVDFAGAYSITTAQIINVSDLASIATVNVNLRRAWNDPETANTIVTAPLVVSGGSGYVVNDTITLAGGVGTPAVLKVTGVSSGAVTLVSLNSGGTYTTVPLTPAAQASTSGIGTGATFNTNTALDGFAVPKCDVADLSSPYAVTGITQSASATVSCVAHPFSVNDKCRLHGIAGMTQIESTFAGTATHLGATVTAVLDANHFVINVNSSAYTAWSATPIFSEALGGISNVVYKCISTNRAGTNVYEFDLSSFTTPGNYYIYIPGFGISDPFYVGTEAYAISAGNLHNGLFNVRVGCNLAAPGFIRPLACVDGGTNTDGTVIKIYWSTLIATLCTEGGQAFKPTGGVEPLAGMGGFSDEGTMTVASAVWSGGVVTVTSAAPHGIPNGPYPLSLINNVPTGYNFTSTTSGGLNNWATVTGLNTFTFPLAANPGALTTAGLVRTGFLTSTRATGFRQPSQDAGDNDDLACDHIHAYQQLAWVFNNIPAASRFTPFTVPLSTTLLNPTTYAGTDDLPPLFHEIVWYADNYRVAQDVNGDVPGGYGIGSLSSQIPAYPEPIQNNRGVDPLGNRAGQTTMMFVYASDHYTTMQYAAMAAQVALICQGYALTTLATTWFNSAVAAYNRSLAMMINWTTRDAYYVTQLRTPYKMGWTTPQYNEAMDTMNALAETQQHAAAGALYRFLGTTAGQNPYGNMIEGFTMLTAPTIGAGSGGTNYAVGDLIQINGGTPIGTARTILRVLTISGSAVATVGVYFSGNYTVAPTQPWTQLTTTGNGTGFSFTTGGTTGAMYATMASENPNTGNLDYVLAQATPTSTAASTYMLTRSGGTSAANSAFYSSTSRSFAMMQPVNSLTSSCFINQPLQNLIAHMMLVAANGVGPTTQNSNLLTSMSAHIQWINGANLPGLSQTVYRGVRTPTNYLHEDSFKMGVSLPPGVVHYGYFGFAPQGSFAFNGTSTNTDGTLTTTADNTNGTHQTAPASVQPGSTKVWNGWRFGESFWEMGCQSRYEAVFVAEFQIEKQIHLLATALYVHGWDGNT